MSWSFDPIPVSLVTFRDPTDGPGFAVSTSLSSKSRSKNSNHTIEFHWWMKAFWVVFSPRDGEPLAAYVGADGSTWYPEAGWQPESMAKNPAKKLKAVKG